MYNVIHNRLCWDFEDDYSHNHIERNRDEFAKITPEQKENIIQYANDTSIAEAAKKFRLYGHQIQRWIDDKARSER